MQNVISTPMTGLVRSQGLMQKGSGVSSVDSGDGMKQGFGLGSVPFAELSKRRSRKGKRAYGKLWPHGEFSLVWRDSEVEAGDAPRLKFTHTEEQVRFAANCVAIEDIELPPQSFSLTPSGPLLDSAPKSSQGSQRPETYGRNGITPDGARKVKALAHLLQERHGKDRLSFLTLTVPPLADDAAVRLAQNWGSVVRQWGQWLGRRLKGQSLPTECVSVTEFQPRRAQAGRLESLHLHQLFVGRNVGGTWGISPSEVRSEWVKLLSRVSGADCSHAIWPDMKRVKSSASNYLGKYMSKGAKNVAPLAEQWGWECIPRQWWSMSKSGKDWVRKATLSSSTVGEFLEDVVNAYFSGGNPFFPGYLNAIHITMTGVDGVARPMLVGYSGRFDNATLKDVYTTIRGLCQGRGIA